MKRAFGPHGKHDWLKNILETRREQMYNMTHDDGETHAGE